jgi:hypothetical protein
VASTNQRIFWALIRSAGRERERGIKRGGNWFFIPKHLDLATERCDALPASGIHMLALRERWIWVGIRRAVDKSLRASQRHESLQTESSEGVPSFDVEREFRPGLPAAGNQPASPKCVSLCQKIAYNMRNGGGGNCTRVTIDTSHCRNPTCENGPLGLSDLRRDDKALREFVASWHRMTLPPELRQIIGAWPSLPRNIVRAIMALIESQDRRPG